MLTFLGSKCRASIVTITGNRFSDFFSRHYCATLLRDISRFNASNCNVVANNRVYVLSYSVELFVVLQRHHLRVHSKAGKRRRAPSRPSIRAPVPVRPLWVAATRGVGVGGASWWERDEWGLEGDTPAARLPIPLPPHTAVNYISTNIANKH